MIFFLRYVKKVVSYDAAEDWYKVKYTDGEEEDLTWLELVEILPIPNSTPEVKVGTHIRKEFPGHGFFTGTVTRYDTHIYILFNVTVIWWYTSMFACLLGS